MRLIAIIAFLTLTLYTVNAGAVEFKLGEFNIAMDPPATVDHISYASDTYDEAEINTATFGDLFIDYKVTVSKLLSGPMEALKSTPIPGYYDSISDIEIDGKPATMILANKFTTIEYIKDDKTLITLRFEDAEGTDSSKSIAATIKSFNATRTNPNLFY